MTTFSIDPDTSAGIVTIIGALVTLVGAVSGSIISVVIAIRQTTTNRRIARVENHTDGLVGMIKETSRQQGAAEEQVRQAAGVLVKAQLDQVGAGNGGQVR